MTSLSLEILFNNLIMPLAELLSKFPVGSSAMMIGVSLANALAIATLCFWPPDNLDTLVFLNLYKSTVFINSSTLFFISFLLFPFSKRTNSIF